MDETEQHDPETPGNPVIRRWALLVGPLAAITLGLWLWAGGNSPALAMTSGLLVWVAVWWLTEPVPAPLTSMLPLALLPAVGVLTPAQVAESVGNELILLLMVLVSVMVWGKMMFQKK